MPAYRLNGERTSATEERVNVNSIVKVRAADFLGDVQGSGSIYCRLTSAQE